MDKKQLIKRIEALEKWQKEKTGQQISFPLDNQSVQILNKYFLSKINNLYYEAGAGGKIFKEIFAQQDGRINAIATEYQLIKYTPNITTNVLTLGLDVVNLGQSTLQDNTTVIPASTFIENAAIGTPTFVPSGTGGIYYVVNSTSGGTQIQLSDTLGGAAVDITAIGTGDQYLIIL